MRYAPSPLTHTHTHCIDDDFWQCEFISLTTQRGPRPMPRLRRLSVLFWCLRPARAALLTAPRPAEAEWISRLCQHAKKGRDSHFGGTHNEAQVVVLDRPDAKLSEKGRDVSESVTDVARSLALGAGTHDFVGVVARAHDAQPDLALLLDAHLQRTGKVRRRQVHMRRCAAHAPSRRSTRSTARRLR